jgi:hypothetical protein
VPLIFITVGSGKSIFRTGLCFVSSPVSVPEGSSSSVIPPQNLFYDDDPVD